MSLKLSKQFIEFGRVPLDIALRKTKYDGGVIRLIRSTKQRTCVCCGIEATLVIKVKNKNDIKDFGHYRVYAIFNDTLRQMTVDHVLPLSKGGRSGICNQQLMCYSCNTNNKRNFILEIDWQKIISNPSEHVCHNAWKSFLKMYYKKFTQLDFILEEGTNASLVY